MKKPYAIVLTGLLVCSGSIVANAQAIYLKVYPYKNTTTASTFPAEGAPSLTDGLGTEESARDNGKSIKLTNYIKLSSLQYDLEQTLNIGSQGTGAGAGKVTFTPIVITKTLDAISTTLMQNCASGTPFTLEIIFVSNASGKSAGDVRYKMQVGLAAVKSVSASSIPDCGNGCPNIAESVSFEYGQLIVQTYTQKPTGEIVAGTKFGWDRIKNISINQ